MNKQELIKKYEKEFETIYGFPVIRLSLILEDLKQLDEPQKVVVPQIVADYIKYTKEDDWDLQEAMDDVAYEDDKDLRKWFNNNIETFVRAWLDGYTVEKEPKYTVKIKGKIGENLLVYGWGIKRYFFARTYNDSSKRGEHTRKELEEDGFGWVFDCPGIEIEEVE